MRTHNLLNAKAIAAALLVLCMVGLYFPAEAREPNTLVFGRVTSKPHKAYKRYSGILNYAVERMSDLGITKGKIKLLKNNQELIESLKNGEVDWITETIYSALIYQREAKAQLLVQRWKSGRQFYKCYFITRKDSGIASLSDLVGKKLAFEDPGSTTGYFIPASMLTKAGLKMVQIESPRAAAPADGVGYLFSHAEINIATLVHKGLTDAGAYSDIDWSKESDTPKVFKKDLVVFAQSEPIPRSMELVRHDLSDATTQRLKQILLAAHKDAQGKAALKAYAKTSKLEKISESTLETIEKYRQLLGKLNP